jgi:chromosome segregation ATPase
MLVAGCLIAGISLGAFFMYRKYNIDIHLLETDLGIAHERLRELLGQYNVVRSKKDKITPTKLDDSFKAQLQIKDDTIDRLNGLLESKTTQLEHDSKNLEIAASQILVLEGRISKNKKVAIEREEELVKALTKINDHLSTIDDLESNNRSEGIQLKSSNDEIDDLKKTIKIRDNKLERLNTRVTELESELEEHKPIEGETGYYKKMKKFN